MVKIPDQQLKEILVKEKLIAEEDFDSILVIAKRMGQQVADILVSRNYIKFDYYKQLVGRYFGVPLANLVHQVIDEAVFRRKSCPISVPRTILTRVLRFTDAAPPRTSKQPLRKTFKRQYVPRFSARRKKRRPPRCQSWLL